MIASRSHDRQKLSTPPPRCDVLAHNRDMNNANIAEGLGRFLSLADAAQVLGISPRRAYALVHTGELPAIRLGTSGAWRIEREVLEGYISAKYEETRRMNLWNQSDYSTVMDLDRDRVALGADRRG
jgi:excisionase family DNA binding protein